MKGGTAEVLIKLNLLSHYIGNSPEFFSKGTRLLTVGEQTELIRVFSVIEKLGSDPNVQDVYLKNPISQRQMIMILSSQCPDLIEGAFTLLAFNNQQFSVENDAYSFWLYALCFHPEVLPVLMNELGWRYQTDLTDTLKEIRVYAQYYRRPKRTQRHKGYRDKGSMQSEQSRLRRDCLTDYYAEQARFRVEHERSLHDTMELMVGFIS